MLNQFVLGLSRGTALCYATYVCIITFRESGLSKHLNLIIWLQLRVCGSKIDQHGRCIICTSCAGIRCGVYHVYTTCIPHVYHVYTMCIPCVFHVYAMCRLRVYHVYTMCIPCAYHLFTLCLDHVYTMCIPLVYHVYTMRRQFTYYV